MKLSTAAVLALALALLPLGASEAAAQDTYQSLGLGLTLPAGDLADVNTVGFTFRGQAGLRLTLLDVHLQTGVTSLTFQDSVQVAEGETADFYHAGLGARLGLGATFVGANAIYVFGDLEDGWVLLPEVGLRFWKVEAVADYALGDQNWLGLRINWRI